MAEINGGCSRGRAREGWEGFGGESMRADDDGGAKFVENTNLALLLQLAINAQGVAQ